MSMQWGSHSCIVCSRTVIVGNVGVALTVLGELNVAQVQHRGHEREDILLGCFVNTDSVHSLHGLFEVFSIVYTLDREAATVGDVTKIFGLIKLQRLDHLLVRARQELVENMESTLAFFLIDDTRLLEQIWMATLALLQKLFLKGVLLTVINFTTTRVTISIELNFKIFALDKY